MAEVAASSAPDSMQGVVPSASAEVVVPEEPENISETLYIQNLNEKIKIDGNHFYCPTVLPNILTISCD
jgi:U2 small nuclear ribonucleoprotein B''